MHIRQVSESRIHQVDFNNLNFGEQFTDHMMICHYREGAWQTPEILPYGPLTISPSMSALHYGQAVFEGMKAFKDNQGGVWLFRPEENFHRLNKSAKRLCIPEFPEDYFFNGLETLLNLDQEWIKPGIGNSLYVRPFCYASQAGVQASASKEYTFIIICAPVRAYYNGELNVLIAEHYSRAASGGVGFAKAAGNYAAQFYPTALALEKGYQQIIWTDAKSHQYLEEAGTMNIFFRINDTLVTAPISDRILDGITRKSVIDIAKSLAIRVEERQISVDELLSAYNDHSLKEIFGSGTAVVISPINSFGYKDKRYELDKIDDSVAELLKTKITSIQYNQSEDPFGWRRAVPSMALSK